LKTIVWYFRGSIFSILSVNKTDGLSLCIFQAIAAEVGIIPDVNWNQHQNNSDIQRD